MNPFPKADELTRRQFVSNAARAYLGVHLFPMLGGTLASAAVPGKGRGGTARKVIYLFMSGGMSHVDTFDPKPKKKAIMGKTEAIATTAPDVMVGHYLRKTARVMDKVCVINSMNSTQGAHEQGSYMMHTSYTLRGTIKHPALGAWAVKVTGAGAGGFYLVMALPSTQAAVAEYLKKEGFKRYEFDFDYAGVRADHEGT